MERHMRLSRAAVVLVTIALIAAIAAAVWFASPDAPYVPSEDSGAALGAAAPAEDGTVASGYQPSGKGISEGADTPNSAITTIRNSGNGSYYLTSNIVVNSLTDCVFSGTLDGNGKTIYIRYDSGEKEDPNVDPTYVGIGALFGNLDGATIKNAKIVVETFRYVEGSAGTRNVGIIAGDAWGGVTIENVYVALQYSPTSNGRSYFLDSGVHSGSWTGGKDVELNFGAVLGKSGSSDVDTDVTLKNVTVDNQTTGDYGFSAWIRHGDYCDYKVSMGHFVGWVTGELSMQNCTLRGGESAKMTIKREGSGGSTTNQSGAVIGRLDKQSGSTPSLTIAGLDMEMAINFGTYKVMNIDIGGNNGIIYGNDANNAYTVSVSDIFWNENSGDPGWYDGDDQNQITYNNLTKYDPNTIGVSFDNDQIVLSAMSQYIDKAELNSITFNKVTYSVWDKLIATDPKAVGQWTQVVTVAKPKSKTGGNITYTTEMGTGTFSLEGGETITGVSGNSYTAEREYNGNAPQSPSVVLSSGGGSYADVWKTTNASANVGQYTMTFDKNAFTDAVVAAGSDGLTYIAKNGIVYSPESIDPVGRLNIANDINVTVTKAPVEVVVANIQGTFYDGDPMPKLTVQSVTPDVPGEIAWNDSSLVYGKNEYGWTWTPEDDNNYQPDTGTVTLEVLQATINEIVVSGDFETQYTAYDAFNPEGMVVTAYYDGDPEHERGVVLKSSDYTVSVADGDINRLLVANTSVTVTYNGLTDTADIIVSKLAVGIPDAIQDLVYNGAQRTGVEASADGYYLLSGNTTATYAGDYVATATLTDKANTRWDTAEPDDTTPKEIGWSIAKMVVSGEIVAPESLVYDGLKKAVSFDGQLSGNDEFGIAYDGDCQNVTADGFTVTVSLPNDNNYEWADGVVTTAAYKIEPKDVEIESIQERSKTYDGNVVDPKSLFIAPNGVNDEGALQLAFVITVDGENRDEILNAGSYTVTAVLADGQTNYTAQSAQARYEIAKVVLTGTLTFDDTATYDGTAKTATFNLTSDNLVGQDKVGEVTYNGVDRINVTGQAIVASVALPSSGNYQWQDGVEPTASLTIVKATPAVTVKLSDDMPGNLTVAATLDNDWLVRTDNTGVEGTLAWDKAGELLQQGEVKYDWKFVPTDSNNYNNETGSFLITASEDTLQSIMVKDGTYKTKYTAYEDFDPTGLVVIAQYASGTAVEVTSGFTLGNDKALTDGQITVTLNGVSTTITVTVNKREIPLPAATEGLIFNGEEQNGIDQKWIEQYAEFVNVEGNSQRDAGDYRATVTLTKDTNYVTWKGGSVDDETIEWTIAQMTLDGAVLAAGSLEYDGNAKEAAFDLTAGTLFGSDQVTIVYGGVADRVNVTGEAFTATAVLPSGDNYKWETDAPSASFAVTPKRVVIGVTGDLSKTYDGQAVDPDTLFTPPNGVGGGALTLTVAVDGGVTILNAGSYTVTAVLAQGQPNYTAKQAVAEYSVSKANPTVNPTADVQGALYTSDDLYEIALNLGEQDTPGTVSWDEGQRLTAGKQEYKWTFVPTDEVNYNGATGGIKLTAEQAQLVSVTVDVMPDTAYTAFDAFDPEGMVVTAHYPNDDTKQVALNDLSLTVDQGSINRLVVASKTVTVSYSDGGVTKSDTITIEVLPLKVAAPTAKTDLVYNGAEQTGVEEGEHYTLSGDTTATNAGVYSATAKLKDKANTTWEDGTTDDVSIAWTIREPVTSDEVIDDILAMEKVTWQNAEEFLDLEARYDALDKSEQTADATAKLEVLRAQYDALRNAAFGDIEAAHEVTAKSLGKALAAAAAGLSAAAIALAIAKRRSI